MTKSNQIVEPCTYKLQWKQTHNLQRTHMSSTKHACGGTCWFDSPILTAPNPRSVPNYPYSWHVDTAHVEWNSDAVIQMLSWKPSPPRVHHAVTKSQKAQFAHANVKSGNFSPLFSNAREKNGSASFFPSHLKRGAKNPPWRPWYEISYYLLFLC
jgi:hypothetical protein